MPVTTRMTIDLLPLLGATFPTVYRIAAPTPQPVTIHFELSAVDRLSSALSELRLEAPHLSSAGFGALQQWAQSLSSRITYLLEQIGPLEFDPAAGTVLIRSNPPDAYGNSTQYYEVLLQAQTGGQFVLRRYRAERGVPGRTPIDLFLTHEVLNRLVNDLIDTMP